MIGTQPLITRRDMIHCALCDGAPCDAACRAGLRPAELLRSIWFDNEQCAAGRLPGEVPCASHRRTTPLGCHRAPALGSLQHNSKFPLAVYFTYDSVCVSVLFSQIIPPSPSSTVSKSLFSVSVSFAALHVESSVLSFYIPYMCVSILYLSFSF